ncbi:unnamed protein product [Bemisia tabaci]|uniref:DAGKc domain-containing protein n=1 Tax=Bemisia tabaci TaxID=7038 RepID=A0A9P0F751_BEMTA|nr:PREDICTED: ceramide kinase [Bemisia tabaci]CAH0392523.1 unnamed protein product [Bemisia tabaci]
MTIITDICSDLDEVVLLNSFFVKKKRHKVYLNKGILLWELDTNPYTRSTVSVQDILAVDSWPKDGVSCCSHTEKHTSFKISYASKKKKNKWKCEDIIFQNSDQNLVSRWISTLNSFIEALTSRPKRLMMFVNPYGGKKQGVSIFKNVVKPLLDVAKIEVDLTITQRPHHARDTINSSRLQDFDGIVCIGGDGTFSEVMNAVLFLAAKEKGVNINNLHTKIPASLVRIGVIPGGSTDSLAYSLHGTCDIQTAVIHIITGHSTGLDISSVHNGVNFCSFFVTVMAYGFLGDVLKESERFRWLGPKRYDFAGFFQFIQNKGYEVEITFLKQPIQPAADSKCLRDCKRCQLPQRDMRKQIELQKWMKVRGKYWNIAATNVSSACPRSPNGVSPHCHLGDGSIDLVLVKHGSIFNNLRMLLTVSGKKKSVYDLPFVDVHRTSQLKLVTLPQRCRSRDVSSWNCDGEVLEEPAVFIQSHRQVLQVFYRGAEQTLSEARKRRCFCF